MARRRHVLLSSRRQYASPTARTRSNLLKSSDLVNWRLVHPFYEHPDLSWTVLGEDCSCPDFFKLGDKHVLMCISHVVGARCYVGRFDREKEKFFPEQHVRMNWPGGSFFAPESLVDAKGRRIFWAWVIDPRLPRTRIATGSGAQSMPRVLSLAKDNTPPHRARRGDPNAPAQPADDREDAASAQRREDLAEHSGRTASNWRWRSTPNKRWRLA